MLSTTSMNRHTSLKHWELGKFFVHSQQYLSYIYIYIYIYIFFFFDYALSQVAKMSRSLQAEKIDLTAIASLVDATLNIRDDAILPVANWVLQLLDIENDFEAANDTKITTESITSF